MHPPCELVVKYVLPAFRSLIAKELIEAHDFSQVAAAKKLRVTQAAISHYLYSKRGNKQMKLLESVPLIRSSAREFAEKIAGEKMSQEEAMLKFCEICMALRRQEVICKLHRELVTLPPACDLCSPSQRP
jgi:predicted transcriptional regulator